MSDRTNHRSPVSAPHESGAMPAWPPSDAMAMRDWQGVCGGDAAIARRLGLCQATIAIYRRRLGVPALPRGTDRRVRERRPRARLTQRAVARLYDGRRYEDLALRQRPANAVRGIGWVL